MEKWVVKKESDETYSLYIQTETDLIKVLEGKSYISDDGLIKGESKFLEVKEPDGLSSVYMWNGKELVRILEKKRDIFADVGLIKGESNFLGVFEWSSGGIESLYMWNGRELVKILGGEELKEIRYNSWGPKNIFHLYMNVVFSKEKVTS